MINRTTPRTTPHLLMFRKINCEFYNLIKKLQKSELNKTAQLTELAYEHFLSELKQTVNRHRLN